MSKISIPPNEVLQVLKAIRTVRTRVVFALACGTGLKYSELLRLRMSDVFLSHGQVADKLLIRKRRSTKRHPTFTYELSGSMQMCLRAYQSMVSANSLDCWLFPTRPGRAKPVSARHVMREINEALAFSCSVEGIAPAGAQKYYLQVIQRELSDSPYLQRVACGKRLPSDGRLWMEKLAPRVRSAQIKAQEFLGPGDAIYFWMDDRKTARRVKI